MIPYESFCELYLHRGRMDLSFQSFSREFMGEFYIDAHALRVSRLFLGTVDYKEHRNPQLAGYLPSFYAAPELKTACDFEEREGKGKGRFSNDLQDVNYH